MHMDHDGPPDTKPRGSSGYLPGGVSGEKPAPTAAEVAAARQHATWLRDQFTERTRIEDMAVTLLAALDAAEAERKDAIGALDDAGARCNPDDDLATRVEKLAKDRDEIARLWAGVCDLLWPNREPDDAFGVDDVRESVKELRESLDAAEARATAAETELRERSGADVSIRYRLATAERERDELSDALKLYEAFPELATGDTARRDEQRAAYNGLRWVLGLLAGLDDGRQDSVAKAFRPVVEKIKRERDEARAALKPFAECWNNFKAAPVDDKRHPRIDPIACAFEPWRRAAEVMKEAPRG